MPECRKPIDVNGAAIYSEFLPRETQIALVASLRSRLVRTPFFHPVTGFGKKMSVKMTSMGKVGWISDRQGYRYESCHPNGHAWPPIPPQLLQIWHELTGLDLAPDTCLINFYGEAAKMGLHQDKDEADFAFPVLSLSLGDSALFRVGGTKRGDPTKSIWLHSGDVALLAGRARLAYHGIERIKFGSSSLLPHQGRLNLTMRVALANQAPE